MGKQMPVGMTMKLAITLALMFLLPFGASAQLAGTYCNSGIFHNSCFSFTKDGQFTYDFTDCTRFRKGVGTYKLNGSKLILSFTDTKEVIPSCKINFTETIEGTDSVNIITSLYDVDTKEPIPYTALSVVSNNGKDIAATLTNLNGYAILSYLRSDSTANLVIMALGYSKCVQPIVLNKKYVLNGGLQRPIEVIRSGQVWTWRIKKADKSAIVVTRDKNPNILYIKE